MSLLISAHQLRKAFAARPLFDGLTFSIAQGDRIGLIGPNGAGKSTLLKILAKEEDEDSGTLSFQRGVRVGYLAQVPSVDPAKTVLDTVMEGVVGPADDWQAVGAAHEIISRLELDRLPSGSETRVGTLSGGWKKRVALARELAKAPDLLLLDEPTNHLDVESILWLEEFLAQSQFATMTITHDRAFLQKVSRKIFELDRRNPGGMLIVDGSYADYLERKQEQVENQQSRGASLGNRLRRETEWLRRGAKARTTKQQARIQRAETLADEVAELNELNRERSARLEFLDAGRSPKKLIEAKGISKTLGGRTLFSDWSGILRPGTRLGLLGANGCGKSTLIRVLLGQETPDQGSVFRADSLQVAYFEQNRDRLDPEVSLLRTLCPKGEFVDYRGSRLHVRSWMDRFLFRPEQGDMAVGKLSGGEQSRVLLALLMLQPANCLVLDEPTNDLDVATLDLLEDCLTDFPGLVILVSHDRYFLDQVSTQLLAFDPAGPSGSTSLIEYADLGQWQTARGARAKTQAAASPAAGSSSTPSNSRKRKLGYKEQRELDGIEARVLAQEELVAQLTAQSNDPKISSNFSKLTEVTGELEKAQAELERLFVRWSELES